MKEKTKIPQIASRLLERILFCGFSRSAAGDFLEQYCWIRKRKGRLVAGFWIWAQILQLAIPMIIEKSLWSLTMIKNYILVMLRNFQRRRMFTLINVFGMSVAMAVCLLILLWVVREFNYDNFHPDPDRIFRIAVHFQSPSLTTDFARVGPPVGTHLKDDYPQVESVARLMASFNPVIKRGSTVFNEPRTYFCEPELFEILHIPLVSGNAVSALSMPNQALISSGMISKYFSGEDPLGKTLEIDGLNYQIAGVLEAYPENTHLKCDFLLSMTTIAPEVMSHSWGRTVMTTYVKLRAGVDVRAFAEELRDFESRYRDTESRRQQGLSNTYVLQPVRSIHLKSDMAGESEPPGDEKQVLLIATIGLLVLLIACFNFINLSTVQFSRRALEVGLRKVVGANKRQLISQFLGESIVLSMLSFLLALFLAFAGLQHLNLLTGGRFKIPDLFHPVHLLLFIALLLFVGVCSGVYPAFVLSRLNPGRMLKNRQGMQGGTLRKVLVVAQFTVSSILLICVLVISSQMRHMRTVDLGFDKRQKVVVPLDLELMKKGRVEALKSEFRQIPGVVRASASFGVPGRVIAAWATHLAEADGMTSKVMFYIYSDFDFMDQYDFQMAAGRKFDPQLGMDLDEAFIVNETAVRTLGLNSAGEAIGRRIEDGKGTQGTIIGVVKDFHFQGLNHTIESMVLGLNPEKELNRYFPFGHLTLTLETRDLPETLMRIERLWKTLNSNIPYTYHFIDDLFDRFYRSQTRMQKIVFTFTWIGLSIGCLGLFGLASFTAQQRTKEIGIRKVLGASTAHVVGNLSRSFLFLVALANGIAWPIGYWIMREWLENFTYRISLTPWPFLAAGALSIWIALITVSSQSLRAAVANPVKTLRYE